MSNNQPIYLTAEGLDKIKEELSYLVNTRRHEVAMMIAEAKAEGDISENAGYDEAKTVQGFLEGRIRELENIVKNAVVIQESEQPADEVAIGRTVTVREDGYPSHETYTIVGTAEADPKTGRISNHSPIGQALLGKRGRPCRRRLARRRDRVRDSQDRIASPNPHSKKDDKSWPNLPATSSIRNACPTRNSRGSTTSNRSKPPASTRSRPGCAARTPSPRRASSTAIPTPALRSPSADASSASASWAR